MKKGKVFIFSNNYDFFAIYERVVEEKERRGKIRMRPELSHKYWTNKWIYSL